MKMIQILRKRMTNQKGFTLVELLVVVAVLGVLAAIAIPKYVDSTATANGGKVLADLQAIDSAIQQYSAVYGTDPTALNGDLSSSSVLKNYFSGNTVPTPPAASASIKINGTAITHSDTIYKIAGGQATFQGSTATTLANTGK